MKETHRPNKHSKQKKKNKHKNKVREQTKATSAKTADKGVFDLGEGLTLFNPLTEGLGFKDKVSDGVYTMEVEHEAQPSSDGGTLSIGNIEMGDGVLNIGDKGAITVNSADVVQPALFHSGHDGLIKRTAKKSGESFFGALIDVLLLVAVTIFTAAAATEVFDFSLNFELLLAGGIVELGKVALIFGAYFLSYRILARVFYGKTLGEWSSRHQLGLLMQQHSITYPIRVLIREMICLVTGVFVFPLLSAVFKKDIGYYVSGLQTYVEQKKR